jgi:hypothetical protein
VTHKFSKYFILAIGALSISALPALADVPCSTDTNLAQFLSDFGGSTGCTVTADGVTLDFSAFNYNNSGITVAPSSIGVSEVGTPDGPGLDFDTGSNLNGANLTEDVKIGFTVTAPAGTLLSDVYIALNNVFVQNGGDVSYTEQICLTDQTCDIEVEDPSGPFSKTVLLSQTAIGGPVGSLIITKDVDLTTGDSETSKAKTSDFLNEYSTVPEPRATSFVLALGLLAGFAFFKRRQATQS